MFNSPLMSVWDLIHDKVFTPSTFIAHEPHTPCAQDLLKVNEESISFFILIKKFLANIFKREFIEISKQLSTWKIILQKNKALLFLKKKKR